MREHYIAQGPSRTGRPKNRKPHQYDAEWTRVARAWLLSHPFCLACQVAQRSVLADVVDHIFPIRIRPDLLYNSANFQSLCSKRPHSCHQRKTGYERRGIILDFRNRRRIVLQ